MVGLSPLLTRWSTRRGLALTTSNSYFGLPQLWVRQPLGTPAWPTGVLDQSSITRRAPCADTAGAIATSRNRSQPLRIVSQSPFGPHDLVLCVSFREYSPGPVLRKAGHGRSAARQTAVGAALLPESNPRVRGVRRRQGGRERAGGLTIARGAPRLSPAYHAAAGEEDRARDRAVGSPGAGRPGDAALRGPDSAASAAGGARPAAGDAAARSGPSDEAGAPPDRPPAALLICRPRVEPQGEALAGG